VREYSEKFDRWVPKKLNKNELEKIISGVPEKTLEDIKFAQVADPQTSPSTSAPRSAT